MNWSIQKWLIRFWWLCNWWKFWMVLWWAPSGMSEGWRSRDWWWGRWRLRFRGWSGAWLVRCPGWTVSAQAWSCCHSRWLFRYEWEPPLPWFLSLAGSPWLFFRRFSRYPHWGFHLLSTILLRFSMAWAQFWIRLVPEGYPALSCWCLACPLRRQSETSDLYLHWCQFGGYIANQSFYNIS